MYNILEKKVSCTSLSREVRCQHAFGSPLCPRLLARIIRKIHLQLPHGRNDTVMVK